MPFKLAISKSKKVIEFKANLYSWYQGADDELSLTAG